MRLKSHAVNHQTTIRLTGLEPNRIYTDKESGQQYYGEQLMQHGLHISASNSKNDFNAFLFHLV